MPKGLVKLNLGCGAHLTGGFINVDKYLDLESMKAKKGIYRDAKIDKGAEFVQADVCNLPFEDNFADYIETFDLIEHLPRTQLSAAFNEMARVLKPGGAIVLVTTDFDQLAQMWTKLMGAPYENFTLEAWNELSQIIYGSQIAVGEYHHSAFNPKVLWHFLTEAGLTVERITVYPMDTDASGMDLQAHKIQKGSLLRSNMLYVKAHK